MPPTKHEWHDSKEHKQPGDPEPTEGGGESSDEEEAHPQSRDHQVGREQDQCKQKEPTLIPAGQPGCNGGLVRVVNAFAVLDRATDPGPSGVIEATLEGKPPLRVASLPDPVVHRIVAAIVLLVGEAGFPGGCRPRTPAVRMVRVR